MKKRLIGFNSKQVDSYLENLKESHRKQLEALRNKIRARNDENTALLDEFESLKLQNEAYENRKACLMLAQKRLDLVLTSLNKMAEEESDLILKSAKENLARFGKDIGSMKIEIKNTRENIKELMDNITGIFNEVEYDEVKTKAVPLNKREFKVLPYVNKTVISNVVNKPQESFWEMDEEKITADGASPIVSPVQPRSSSAKSSFWDDVEDLGDDKENASVAKVIKKVEVREVVEVREAAPPPVKAEAAPVKEGAPATVTPEPVVKSSAVEKEIEHIRHKYIVGKLAGEDLLDSEGRVIISKNSTITAEVIAKAEMEGKLSELIVNMILPGM